MHKHVKAKIYLLFLIIFIIGASMACSKSSPVISPPLSGDSSVSSEDSSSDNRTQNLPGEKITLDEQLIAPERVDVVYFHSSQRCKTCLYIEQRVVYVIETYFQDEIDSGQLIFKILNLGDKENTSMITKYNAVSSQLYLNIVLDEIDHIKHVKEVWFKDYLRDEKLFDEVVKGYIKRSLNGEL
jgi:hypothetical protein